MTSDEVTANSTTTTGFTVNIPVSKVWEDDSNKLGQRPTKVVFKLYGSDGSEYTKEISKTRNTRKYNDTRQQQIQINGMIYSKTYQNMIVIIKK